MNSLTGSCTVSWHTRVIIEEWVRVKNSTRAGLGVWLIMGGLQGVASYSREMYHSAY